MYSNHETGPSHRTTRRRWLQGATGAAAALGALPGAAAAAGRRTRTAAGVAAAGPVVTNGRIKQSVCAWCFKSIPLETFAQNCAAMGLKSIELVDPKDWPILKKYGLICALTSSHDLTVGFNHKENHEPCIAKLKETIDACAAAGFPTVITFSGLRKGIPDDVGLENAVEGLKKVVGYAEQKKVKLCIEVLNSRVDVEMKGHPDYQCDKVEWAYEVCKRISSPFMTYLFDVYHVQIMQGDIITRIKQFHQYVGHYHVAGVPGRNEPDDSQELNYPPIMKAILATGYQGYVAQEFIPTRDPMQSLREAVKLCDV
jgi:hydroxypyruvate isomerase